MTASELNGASLGMDATQVMQRKTIGNANPTAWPGLEVGDLFGYRAERGGTSTSGDGGWVAIDEMRLGNSLDAVTPLASEILPTGALLIVR